MRKYFNIRKITHLNLKSPRPIFSSHRSPLNLSEISIFSNFIWISSRPAAVVLSSAISLQFSAARARSPRCLFSLVQTRTRIRTIPKSLQIPGNRINQRAAWLVGDDGLTANKKLNNPSGCENFQRCPPTVQGRWRSYPSVTSLTQYSIYKCARSRCWPCWMN